MISLVTPVFSLGTLLWIVLKSIFEKKPLIFVVQRFISSVIVKKLCGNSFGL